MKKQQYQRLNETIYEETLDNGLQVFVLPKKGFRQTYVNFTTRYGSIDSEFIVPRRQERIKVPDGIAHFLEHKMFEEEHGDVFMEFAKTGASANAFTTFDTTTYLFSSTVEVERNLEILLNFVQNPYFTDENVEKEKGIIGQEIKMYEDNPNWRVYFGLLQGLYGDYPVAIDIAGTIDSIAKITKETLYDCYYTFYHPSNMALFVVGDVDPARILHLVQANQSAKGYEAQAPIERFYPELPKQIARKRTESTLDISQPRVLFGFREQHIEPKPTARQKREAAMEVWMDCLFGRSSQHYQKLIDDGLTDQGFGSEYELTHLYGHSIFGGNSKRPEELILRVQNLLLEYADKGIDEADFLRSKKKAIGRFMALLDSPQGIANVYVSQKLRGLDVLTSLDVLQNLDLHDVNQTLREHVVDNTMAISLISPEKGK
ncbi:EF-P 5-aminopentanol modification-associated protein YfmH [Sulfoacidibacillus thermotolerans]|uniref:Peptidase M16 n=1 Tax=Sulfoacidibacillus thermotolerans TaxID=1765684 RepID=A0A2U3DCH5_SULT2|nr:pitrilysin family protein [Sulfoacidibacillus thermotolerans]PWI58945.1 peptidase M16 [Sulfoacidibacillus thermotolerans]